MFYVIMQDGEGTQPLLDIRFPDVSQHGQGCLHLMTYRNMSRPWRKLTLWHSLISVGEASLSSQLLFSKAEVANLSSAGYVQTYVVMKPSQGGTFGSNAVYRDVLFRFGSWCYSGTVQLVPSLSLSDVPHVIPALRMQQSRLDFLCDSSAIPHRSPFSKPMEHIHKLTPVIEEEIMESEGVLSELLEKLEGMGLSDSISGWFEGDSSSSFFEFVVSPSKEVHEAFSNVDLVTCKCYTAQGVVLIIIWFEGTYYVVLGDGSEEQPLLDSRFPDVSSKGRGYQVRSSAKGLDDWPEFRKLSIWQTASALQTEVESRLSTKEGQGAKGTGLVGETKEDDLLSRSGHEGGGGGGGLRRRDSMDSEIELEAMAAEPKEEERSEEPDDSGEDEKNADEPELGAKASSAGRVDTLKALGRPGAGLAPETQPKSQQQAAKQLTSTRVAAPHHIAPLGGSNMNGNLKQRLEKMRRDLGSDLG
ncbi:unnamed protein product, partial [Chrysoparadoxa australica]